MTTSLNFLKRIISRHTSTCRRRGLRKKYRMRPAMELLEQRTLLTMLSWDGGADGAGTSWHQPENWVGDALPGASDGVKIGADFRGIVASGNVSVRSVTSDSPIQISGPPSQWQNIRLLLSW
ncbi:MAG: hypothetical protein GY903_02720 [Fuerstiella sp.]|nr:hypothetical protein [Fuerstiella sp.]MCP4853391.1 hypothetical protein [Fuerstiella sp.]